MPDYVRQEKPVEKQYPKQFTMIKNYRGSYSTVLEPFDYSAPARTVSFRYDEESQIVPAKYALGVFVSNMNMKEMKRGYFSFENMGTLKEMAEKEGLFIPASLFEQSQPTFREIKDALASGEVKQVEKILEGANSKTISDVQSFARKMYSSLNMSIVGYLQETFKSDLGPISLDSDE